MTARLVVTQEAEADILEAYVWYSTRLPRLGEEFLHAIDEAERKIRAAPRRFPAVQVESGLEVRRLLMERFPYGVLFIFDEDRNLVSVIGCFHVRRDPNAWLRRL